LPIINNYSPKAHGIAKDQKRKKKKKITMGPTRFRGDMQRLLPIEAERRRLAAEITEKIWVCPICLKEQRVPFWENFTQCDDCRWENRNEW
jgi:hypothetical protein